MSFVMRGLFKAAAGIPAAGWLLFGLQLPLEALSSGGDYQLDFYAIGAAGGEVLSGGQYAAKGAAGQPLLPGNLGVKTGGLYVDRAGFYNPPHLTFQRGLAASALFPSGTARLNLPPGAVDKTAFDIILNKDILNPLLAEPGEVSHANSLARITYDPRTSPLPGDVTETYIFDEQTPWTSSFLVPGSITMSYTDADGDGVVDGSYPPVRVNTANIWVLDRNRDMWVKTQYSALDPAGKTITIPLQGPGVFSVMGTLDESVKDVYAFPVPFRPNGGGRGIGSGMTGTAAEGITFTNLPQRGNIEIYTLDGLLVRKIAIPDNLSLPQVKWDVKNSAGEKVQSDVYIWRVTSGGNTKTGKLMIIW